AGATKFDTLTRDNVAACPGDSTTVASANCAERHLTIWLDLTQADIDHWEDSSYVAKVSATYDPACLAAQAPGTICGKFLTDPITREEIEGGQAQISGSFTQQSATDLATGINSGSLPVDLVALDVTQVSATLGAESVKLSIAAGLLGLAIVVVFMIVYYRIPGLLASLVSSIVVTHNLLAIVLAGSGFRRPGLLGVDRVRAV